MKSYGIGLSLVALCAAFYGTQNASPVTQKFFFWTFSGSMGLIVVCAFCLGLLVMALMNSFSGWESWSRSRREISRRDRRIEELEREREAMLSAMRAAGTSEEEISFIEDGHKA